MSARKRGRQARSRVKRRRSAFAKGCAILRKSQRLSACVEDGTQALESKHRPIVRARQWACSIFLERCCPSPPDEPKWDYLLVAEGNRHSEAIAAEVHQARGSEVERMVLKKAWARRLLRTETPEMSVQRWAWLVPPSSRVTLARDSPKALLLAKAGIEFPTRTLR